MLWLRFTMLTHVCLTIILFIFGNACTMAWKLLGSRALWNTQKWTLSSEASPEGLGPLADYIKAPIESMEATFDLQGHQLNVMVGPSVIAQGRGLFLTLKEGVKEYYLPPRTAISGYSRGKLAHSYHGEKDFAYKFDSPANEIVFHEKLVPIAEAVRAIADKAPNISDAVAGHYLECDMNLENLENMKLYPSMSDEDFPYIFVPTTEEVTADNVVMFANDLAYSPTVTEEQYNATCYEKNLLGITWIMEFDGRRLVPVSPVAITRWGIMFHSQPEPMEIGVEYSWVFWASRESQA